jgi:hypothetical protein
MDFRVTTKERRFSIADLKKWAISNRPSLKLKGCAACDLNRNSAFEVTPPAWGSERQKGKTPNAQRPMSKSEDLHFCPSDVRRWTFGVFFS